MGETGKDGGRYLKLVQSKVLIATPMKSLLERGYYLYVLLENDAFDSRQGL